MSTTRRCFGWGGAFLAMACSGITTEGPHAPRQTVEANAATSDSTSSFQPANDDRTLDAIFGDLSLQVPEFAGFILEGGVPTLLLTDTSAAVRAITAAASALPAVASAGPSAVKVRKVEYSFAEMQGWKSKLYGAPIPPGVVLVDIDEYANRLRLDVESNSDVEATRSHLQVLGIPLAGVQVGTSVSFRPAQGGSIQGIVSPRIGGVQVGGPLGFQSSCTMGFNAKRPGDASKYFVTNAHCTATIGLVDGTQFGQPILSYPVGQEYWDPPYSPPSAVPGCPAYLTVGCRFADAALVRYNPGILVGLYRLAQTTLAYVGSDPNQSGSFTMAPNQFTVAGELTNAQLSWGTNINKIGMASGWTWGFIVGTCVDQIFYPTVARLCQFDAVATGRPGDSGSPVFIYDSGIPGQGTLAWLVGLLHSSGVDGNGASHILFSPVSGVKQDLGSLTTWSLY